MEAKHRLLLVVTISAGNNEKLRWVLRLTQNGQIYSIFTPILCLDSKILAWKGQERWLHDQTINIYNISIMCIYYGTKYRTLPRLNFRLV